MMMPKIQFRSPAIRQALAQWALASAPQTDDQAAGYEELIAEWCASNFEAASVMIESLQADGDMMLASLSSDGWAGFKELALLPDGRLAW